MTPRGWATLALISTAALACSSSSVRAATAPVRTLEYAMLSNGKPSGREVDRYSLNGVVDSEFEFNDRGRGPKIRAHYEFGADGAPVRVDVSGTNYLKAPVDEHLVASGAGRAWRGRAEQGSSSRPGFYLSADGASAVELAALARVALRAGAQGVALLPGGLARAEVLADATIASHGHTAHVREIGISGIGFEPATLWVDDAGEYFGSPGSYFAILRTGWEDVNSTLFARQSEAEDAYYARLATRLSRRPDHALAFEHVQVFDAERAEMIVDQTVIVDRDRIVSVGPAAAAMIPAGAERIDGTGRTLLPGLFDMHMHSRSVDGILDIASGVTSGRDVGNDIERLAQIQQHWSQGTAIGPRLWKAGVIDGPGRYQAPTGMFVETVADAVAAVNRYADLGYVQIKLYSSLNPELIAPIAAAAHGRGLRLSGHVPNGTSAAEFVRRGADELQHINFVFLNFLASESTDTRTPERFTVVAENAAGFDLDSPAVGDFIRLLLEHHTTLDVTLAAFDGMFNGRPGSVSPSFAPVFDRLPVQARRQALSEGLPVTAANDQRYRDSYVAMLRLTKKLFDAGVPILVGTDSTPGIMLHRELELEVQAGIPPLRALQNATWLAASVLKQQDTLGSIRPGKKADLLLVEGDPGTRIGDIRRGRLVLRDGVLFEPDRLYAAIGVLPAP